MNKDDLCPVCGMTVDPSVPSVAYHKLYFHFCSSQCRQTFLARPKLYSSGAREEVIKRRVMRLSEAIDEEVAALIISYLTQMMGIKEVVVEGEKVYVIYDLLQITKKQIEEALSEVGIQLGGGWLERLRRGWVYDSEEIELDNLAASPAACCNKPPPGA